jgi:hypothetical protein
MIEEIAVSDPTPQGPIAPPPAEDTPSAAADVRTELNVMFDTWQAITRLTGSEQKRVGAWLKDHLGL